MMRFVNDFYFHDDIFDAKLLKNEERWVWNGKFVLNLSLINNVCVVARCMQAWRMRHDARHGNEVKLYEDDGME